MRRLCIALVAFGSIGCDDTTEEAAMSPFELRFEAVAGGAAVGCTDALTDPSFLDAPEHGDPFATAAP